MATTVTCDVCGKTIVAGIRVERVGRGLVEAGDGHEACGEFCSAACLARRVNSVRPRPDFNAARDLLAHVTQLDELAMAGAYDNDLDIQAALPYDPPTQAVAS